MNQQQPKSITEDARQTGSILLSLVHAGVIPLRLFSCYPGSIGASYMFPGIIFSYFVMGIVTALFFSHLPTTGILTFYVVQITGVLWIVHFFFYCAAHRSRRGVHSYFTGAGWLNLFYPKHPKALSLGIISDGITAIVLALVCLQYNDQQLAAWWGVSFGLSLGSHFLLSLRDAARRRQLSSSMYEQEYYQTLMPQHGSDME